MNKISKLLNILKRNGLYPPFYRIESAGTNPEVIINGKKYLIFCSNNYLGLATRSEIIRAAERALKKHGIGPGGSRFLCGNIALLEQLDHETAKLVGAEDAITFPTGYMANLAIFKALMDPLIGNLPHKKGSGIIFSDEFNHGSIVDGCKLSYAKKIIFRHIDMKDLETKISTVPNNTPKMITIEGVFSVEGDLVPLPEVINIAKKYNAILMIDDAHGVGVMGEKGGGTAQHFGLESKIDIIMGSFDKALGGMGGFLAGSKEIVEYLRIASRSYMLSSAVPAVLAGGLIKAIKICETKKGLREKLFSNANYLRKNLEEIGFRVLGKGEIPVNPVLIGDEIKAIKFSEKLFRRGIYAPTYRWPMVPKGTARIRVTTMSTHTKKYLDTLLEAFEKSGKELKLIP